MFTWEQARTALTSEALPAALVDLDAFDANLRTLLDRTDPRVTLRVATKSIRVPALIRRALERGGARLRGLMPYSAREVALLAEQGFDDFLMGYPVARRIDADALCAVAAAGRQVVATVDHADHVGLLAAAARAAGIELPVCIDIDMSLRPARGVHIGVRRSPLFEPGPVVALADLIAKSGSLRLTSLLAYEAQVAGLPDRNPANQPLLDPIRGLVKRRSIAEAARRRAACLAALRDAGHDIRLVNGGGTGSVGSTSRDPSVTEVTAGSGPMTPTLFDNYADLDLKPALFFALPVCRIPGRGFVTCSGGGYIASGPTGADRSPTAVLPAGLKPLPIEGWGEVQTPFVVPNDVTLRIGDPVICRHAKAGELAERFDTYLLLEGGRVVDRVPTCRGLGGAFG